MLPQIQITSNRYGVNVLKKNMVVLVEDSTKFTPSAKLVNDALDKALEKNLKTQAFTGKSRTVALAGAFAHEKIDHVLALGIGKLKTMERADWLHAGITLGHKLDVIGLKDVSIMLGEDTGKATPLDAAEAMIEGVHMALYRHQDFISKPKPACQLQKLHFYTSGTAPKTLEDRLPQVMAICEGQAMARHTVDSPPNVANPEYMANEARKLEKMGIKVEILEEDELTKLGMNLMMAVGTGAQKADQPRLVIMHYNGGKKGANGKLDRPHAIVGKGVMFDTGGYNIKPGKAMQGMKGDMGGAAAVLGAMRAIAERKPNINVIGVMGCAMNMISDHAFLTDSVHTGYNGKTVEVGHTDAEGRMVLADAMAYTIDKYEPKEIIDLATLTGAVLVALASRYGGLFSTNDRLANGLAKAGEISGDVLWRLPVSDEFLAKSQIADMNNDGSPYGGSAVAAAFLKQFVGTTPWAHLDIAGVAWSGKGEGPSVYPTLPWATGFGVRLLTTYLENQAK